MQEKSRLLEDLDVVIASTPSHAAGNATAPTDSTIWCGQDVSSVIWTITKTIPTGH